MSSSSSPNLFTKWTEEWLGGPIPAETEATCEACVLLSTPAPASGADLTRRIHPRTKCCAYHPTLANFQVGMILQESDPTAAPARDVLVQRVQTGFMVRPLSLEVPPTYSLLYAKSPYMGSALRLVCPYYIEELQGGGCGIWRHRNAICQTWYCKHSRGQVGANFWRALEALLQQMEKTLSRWCLTQLDISDETLEQALPNQRADKSFFSPQELDEVPDENAQRALWGNWAGREAEFYRECGKLVGALTPQQALEIGGVEAALRLRLARRAYRDLLCLDLPQAVRPGSFRTHPLANDQVQIISYSEYAPLVLPSILLSLLPQFEGRTVTEALQVIDEEHNIELEPALVRKLLDFQILVTAE